MAAYGSGPGSSVSGPVNRMFGVIKGCACGALGVDAIRWRTYLVILSKYRRVRMA